MHSVLIREFVIEDDVLCEKNTIFLIINHNSTVVDQLNKRILMEGVLRIHRVCDILLNTFEDDGGIYKGRLNHHERVREIDETHDTKVDLPVEHRQIETVEDENFHGNAGVNRSFRFAKIKQFLYYLCREYLVVHSTNPPSKLCLIIIGDHRR